MRVPSPILALLRTLGCVLALSLGPVATAQAADWALDGYDAVAYQMQGAAVPGKGSVVTTWRGKQWHFDSEANRQLFEMNPRAYAPGFDGLCVVALAEGRAEPGNPRHFVTIGQRLYLVGSGSRREQLLEQPREMLMRAKENFLELVR